MSSVEKAMHVSDFEGKSITDICKTTLGADYSKNQCAHFIDHILNLNISRIYHCKNQILADKNVEGQPAAIRVNDIYNQMFHTGPLSKVEKLSGPYLVYVTRESNMKKLGIKKTMGDHPQKHVGVLYANHVYHYSNSQNKFVKDTVSEFKSKFIRQYGKGQFEVSFYYSDIQ